MQRATNIPLNLSFLLVPMERPGLQERTFWNHSGYGWSKHTSQLFSLQKSLVENTSDDADVQQRSFYDETWVALNWEISLPNEKSHPDFPLWKLGFTPEEVYDAFFPQSFSFICNPDRPAVCGRFGLPSDRLWRFEFVVQAGEDGEQMSEPDNIRRVVFPYITHQGSRYG